jgi:site-specific DNA-methyltransferase (adenine-specific)
METVETSQTSPTADRITQAGPTPASPWLKRTLLDTLDPDIKLDLHGNRCINITRITVGERFRQEYDDILGLAETIKVVGLIHPLVLKKTETGYELVAGGRRIRACASTGETFIPFTLQVDDKVHNAQTELLENTSRRNFTTVEDMKARATVHRMMREKYGDAWTIEKTARVFGVGGTRTTPGGAGGNFAASIKMGNLHLKDPSLAAKLGNLPSTAQLKEVGKMRAVAKHEKGLAAGTITISGDVLNMDCLDGISQLRDQSVHLLLTDPPFGDSDIKQEGGARTNMVYTGLLKSSDNLTPEVARAVFKSMIERMKSKMVPGSYAFTFFSFEHYQFILDTMRANEFLMEDNPIIWHKKRTVSVAQGYNFARAYEPILWGHFKERTKRMSGDGLRDVLEFDRVPEKESFHKFQKPAALLLHLIGATTLPGELVCDPFAGSGETIKRARQLGRNAIGFELNKENWMSAQVNLNQPGTQRA